MGGAVQHGRAFSHSFWRSDTWSRTQAQKKTYDFSAVHSTTDGGSWENWTLLMMRAGGKIECDLGTVDCMVIGVNRLYFRWNAIPVQNMPILRLWFVKRHIVPLFLFFFFNCNTVKAVGSIMLSSISVINLLQTNYLSSIYSTYIGMLTSSSIIELYQFLICVSQHIISTLACKNNSNIHK